MNDESKPGDDTASDLEVAPVAPETATPTEGAPSAAPVRRRRTREIIAAGSVGLLIVGGLAGFGIGRATGDDDGARFVHHGQFRPGHDGFGPRWPDRQRSRFGGGQRRGPQDFGPGGQSGDRTPAPDNRDDDGNSSKGGTGDGS